MPLPPLRRADRTGSVVALNFPVQANPGLAKAIGHLVEARLPTRGAATDSADGAAAGTRLAPGAVRRRRVSDVRDGRANMTPAATRSSSRCRDRRSASRSSRCRASARCGPSCRVKPGARCLQTLRTKVFLTLSDDFSARFASDLCGRTDQLRPQYSVSETGQDARVSLLTGRPTAPRATMSASKSYQHSARCRVRGEGVRGTRERAGDRAGLRRHHSAAADDCYLKPHYLDPNMSLLRPGRARRAVHELRPDPAVHPAARTMLSIPT